MSLFCKEVCERIAQGCFLIKMCDFEQKSKERTSERAKERIPNPAVLILSMALVKHAGGLLLPRPDTDKPIDILQHLLAIVRP